MFGNASLCMSRSNRVNDDENAFVNMGRWAVCLHTGACHKFGREGKFSAVSRRNEWRHKA